jgi:hypothetical protein
VGELEEKRPMGRPRRSRDDNIKRDLSGIGMGRGMGWIDLAQDRDRWQALVNAVVNHWFP